MTNIIQSLVGGEVAPQQVSITITAQDLMAFVNAMMEKIKAEADGAVKATWEVPTLSASDVASMLKVNKSTLWRWEKSGYLKPVKVGARLLYRASDIDAVMGKRQVANSNNIKSFTA